MNKKFISFDGTEIIKSEIERPDRYKDLFKLLDSNKPIISRGEGLSYCGASFGENILSIDTRLFNRILKFNKVNGTITVESGINLGDLLSFIITHGWYFPVIPGYPTITIGGCIGFNVHGKSQYEIGIFGDYVTELFLYHPTYGEIKCSRDKNKDIFNLTIGGFGLTGFITKVTLKLTKLGEKGLLCSKKRVRNIMEAVDVMKNNFENYDSIYSWNNLNKTGNKFGQGIVFFEKFISSTPKFNQIKYNNLNADNRGVLKINLLNKLSTKIMCEIFYLKEILNSSDKLSDIGKASFPINGKEIYFNLFGKKGLREYQMIIPFYSWENFSKDIQELINKSGIPITLGSLKLFKGNTSFLNFCDTGICLAIDVPSLKKSLIFFKCIDDLVIKHSGIVNLSKDSRLKSETTERMFPQYTLFKKELFKYDSQKIFSSSLRERLKL